MTTVMTREEIHDRFDAEWILIDEPQTNERFPAVALSEVYAVIAYYLRHRAAVDAHLAELEAEADRIQAEVDARPETRALREKLLAAKR